MANLSMLPLDAKRLAAFLGFQGRVGRLAFLGWYLSLVMPALVLVAAASFAAMLVPSEAAAAIAAVPVVWAALVLVLVLVLVVRRLHDFDHSGLHALWIGALVIAAKATDGAVGTALGFTSYGALAWLCPMPGSPGPNRFGAVTAAPPIAVSDRT